MIGDDLEKEIAVPCFPYIVANRKYAPKMIIASASAAGLLGGRIINAKSVTVTILN